MFERTLDRWQESTTHRDGFIMKAYQHLLLALGLFVALEFYLFSSGIADQIARALTGVNWLLVLGAYMIVSWLATHVAYQVRSKGAQYAALFVFVAAKAVIFVPLIYFAEMRVPGVTQSAVFATAVGFTGLTAIAFQTRKNFSFLGAFLKWGFLIALGLIIAAAFGAVHLGTWFSVAMIAFAGAAVLYDTSGILHDYPDHLYVSAGLRLFSSITLMLWYMIRFMSTYYSSD
ncbi:MAG: permease [Gammaproteobacteria bacterium]|nr:permease [Gammaproteobacteria bacterium]